AGAAAPARLEDEVADLRGEPVRTVDEPAAGDDPAADPRPDRHEQHVRRTAAGAESVLAPRGHVRVVVHQDGEPNALGDPIAQRVLSPGHVRRTIHQPYLNHTPGLAL